MSNEIQEKLRQLVPHHAFQAIVTRFLGPTNHRGARVVAKAQAGRRITSWDHSLNAEENHTMAAIALAEHYGWLRDGSTLASGGMPDGRGNCYVIVHKP